MQSSDKTQHAAESGDRPSRAVAREVSRRPGPRRIFPRGRAVQKHLARLEFSPFQSAFRRLVILAACGLVLYAFQQATQPLALLGVGLAVTLLLFLLRLAPLAYTRERPLTFTAPVVFAVMLWMGPGVAGFGALLSCLLHARFGQNGGWSRSYVRFQGAQLAVSAFLAGLTLTIGAFRLHLPLEAATHLPAFGNSALRALCLLAAAFFSALAFVLANTLLTTFANFRALANTTQTLDARARLSALALVYALGMLPVLLLAPLGAALGITIGLPLLLALLLGAQVARQTLEVASLRRQLETAQAMGRASVAEADMDVDPLALLQRFLTLSQNLVRADRSLVWTMNQETGELAPVAAVPNMGMFAEEKAVFGEGLIGHAAARIRPRLVADAARDSHRGRREVASGAWLLYPIIVHERLLGVAQWVRPVTTPFTQEDIARLNSLVPQAAVALENVRVRETMHNLASTDGLTGLWNHRRMHELLREEMRRSSRYHRALSVLMLDVDSFKAFNDTYGHPAGDQLLRNIASILRANVRTVDFVGRYGGEEFLVVLPETAKDSACHLAERIRSAVEDQAILVVDGQALRRTVSVGVASYPEDALNPGELVQRADEALYRAKRAGKNRVLWA